MFAHRCVSGGSMGERVEIVRRAEYAHAGRPCSAESAYAAVPFALS
jgi:hypothetical protein